MVTALCRPGGGWRSYSYRVGRTLRRYSRARFASLLTGAKPNFRWHTEFPTVPFQKSGEGR
eukprot:scaffold28235_cov34-Prasinocladus_malaysianus.AAC.1